MPYSTQPEDSPRGAAADSAPTFHGFDCVELYVGNAKQAARYYCDVLGFSPARQEVSESGELGVSYVIGQGAIRLKLTSALRSGSPVHEFLGRHGEGVKSLCLLVDSAERAYQHSVRNGARAVAEPWTASEGGQIVVRSEIAFLGDITCTFVEKRSELDTAAPETATPGLVDVDHVALAVDFGALGEFSDFCQRVLGFHISHRDYTSTEWSGMRSCVVQSADGSIKFPLIEPVSGKRKSQVQEFIDFNGGPGAQHIAFSSENLPATVRELRHRGLDMLNIPRTYYDKLLERVPNVTEDLDDMRELGILADNEGGGYLLQTFTKPFQPQPTLFGEFVQRKGSRGFGTGNIKSLFEAVEREQMLRAAGGM